MEEDVEGILGAEFDIHQGRAFDRSAKEVRMSNLTRIIEAGLSSSEHILRCKHALKDIKEQDSDTETTASDFEYRDLIEDKVQGFPSYRKDEGPLTTATRNEKAMIQALKEGLPTARPRRSNPIQKHIPPSPSAAIDHKKRIIAMEAPLGPSPTVDPQTPVARSNTNAPKERATIHHRVMHHHRDMHQPPLKPCRSILGGIADCKMNGTIASKIYMPRKDIEIHLYVVGM
ncbi:hypothetical protein BGX38DRAFT_175869 [Terfezia claveryi]|nr:hypothetical protein BGX38DRAFT_175869 [Terfezia claveryi]